jgi:hypothetical protein
MRRLLLFTLGAIIFFTGVTLAQPTFTVQNIKDACDGAANGSFEVVVSAATTPPLRVFVFGPPDQGPINATVGTPLLITGLAGGVAPTFVKSYLVVVQDASGSSVQFVNVATINSAISLSLQSTTDNTDCIVSNGTIDINVSGGSGAGFTYDWDGPNGFDATSQDLTGLTGGSYTVEVFDNGTNCSRTLSSIIIADPTPAPQTILNTSPEIVCTGSDLIIQIGGSEVGVNYEVIQNATVQTGITEVGTGSPISFTIPFGTFSSGDNFKIRATSGAVCTLDFGLLVANIAPLPTISGITIPAICQASTTANLNYTSSTGSPNQYAIDYDGIAEGQGFTDVAVTALPATPIVLATPGGAAPGTYNATLTVINNATGCVSIPVPIIISVIANPTITLGPNPSVCIGSPSASLAYSATTGSPNQYSIDFDGGAQAQGFVDVVNAALPVSPISITIPGIAVAGTYNATITVRNSATGCVSASQPITVTINPNPTITLGANPSVCSGLTTTNLTYSATSGSPDQYSLDFNGAAQLQGFIDVVNAPLTATPIAVAVPGAAAPGVYSATIFVRNSLTGCISAPQNITITVIASPTITLGANPSVCLGSPSANLPYTGTTGGANQYSIDFDGIAEGQGFVDIVNVVLPASPIVITIPGAAIAGTYNAQISVLNTVSGCASTQQPITITINPNPTITLGANPTVCTGTTTASLSYSAITGSPNQYSIDFNLAAETAGFVDVVNAALPATPISIVVPGSAAAGVYTASVTVRNGTTGCVSAALPVTVTINLTPTISLGPNPAVCIGAATANLTYTGSTGTPNQYSIDFNLGAEGQGFVDVVNAPLPASPISITIPGAAVAGTYTASLIVTNGTTGCISAPQAITVTISPLPTITLGPNPSVCIGSTTANLGYTATTGTPNQYSIDFDAAAQLQGFVDVVSAALPATPIVINVPGAAVAGTYNGTITVINATTGCVSSTQPITVTINLTPTITLGANPSVCSGVTSASLPYTGTTGTPNQYSINFDLAAEGQGFADVVNAALPATPVAITVPAGALPGTYNATLTVLNTTTGCISAAQAITVTIQPNPTITLGTNPAICVGTTSANLPYTATTGTPTQYSINFDVAAEGQGFVDVVNAALPATPIVITVPGAVLPGTYNATITVLNTTTTCTSASQAITVRVDPIPTITLGPNPTVCTGTTSAALGYTATTGSPNQFSIDYNGAAELEGFVDVVNAALPATPISLAVPAGAAPGLYSATITVSNGTTGCISVSSPITVTINQTPSITLGANPSVCAGSTTANLPYTGTTGVPDQYSIDFNGAAQAQGFVDIVNAALTATPIVITVPGTAAAGVYSGSLFVRNSAGGCLSGPSPITITIVASPTATISGTTTICNGSAANLTVTLTGTGPWTLTYFDGSITSAPIAAPSSPFFIAVNPTITTTYTIFSVSDATVCPGTFSGSAVVTVSQPPLANLVVDATIDPLCSGGISEITVANSQSNVSYQLRNDVGNVDIGPAVVGDGTTINLPTGPLTATTTFNVLATAPGCTPVELTTTKTIVVAGSIDGTLAVTAVDNTLCSGGSTNIQVINSENGVLYQLKDDSDDSDVGPAVPSTGGTINLPTGLISTTTTYYVLATNGTCSIELTDKETVTVSPSPNPALVVAAASSPLCVGGTTDIAVAASESGVTYQLRNSAGNVDVGGPLLGDGGTLIFPTNALATTTTFNVLATAPGCPPVQLTMTATVVVSGNVDASLTLVAAASPICEGTGTDIQIANSENGIDYQLRNNLNDAPIGLPVTGNGGTILLPTNNLSTTTTFNVLATDGTCTIELTDLETVNVDIAPDPASDVDVTLDPLCVGGISAVTVASQSGVLYQLRNNVGNVPIGPAVIGDGTTIDLPTDVLNATTTFNVFATNGACPGVQLMELATVTVAGNLNAGLTVASSASTICSGTSTFIQIQASENTVSYQLRIGIVNVGSPVTGDGGTINIPTGNITATTTYNVVASNGACSIQLTDEETITVSPGPDITLAVAASSTLICSGASTNILITGSQSGVTYQLRNNAGNVLVGSAVLSTGGNLLLPVTNLTTTTSFNVLATLGACSAQLTATATVTIRPLGDPACGGGGTDCANATVDPTIITQPTCANPDAGEVSFTIARVDNTPTNFRVLWSINGTTQTKFTTGTISFNNLNTGAYQYTIIDEGNGKSCGPVDFFLDLATEVSILDKQVTADVTCFGGTDGNAILTVDGSSTGEYWYKYVLDGVESAAQTFTPGAPLPGGLPADDDGFIIIKVDESFNFACPDTVMVRIRHTFPKIDFTVASTEVTTCNGTDGSILVSSIGGGDSGGGPLRVRLKKAVSFTVDPSGYIVFIDFEDVVNGVKEYLDLSQGNYVVDVQDVLGCIQSKPIAVQAPGQVPLASVSVTTTSNDACVNESPNGSITVVISDAGQYEVAVSQDPLNVPADDQFVDYSSPSFPNVVFSSLTRGGYYLYIKSSTTTCPTRTDAIIIDGFQGIGSFEVLSNCGNQNLTINNITGQVDAPFVIRVFDNDDKFFKIDSLTSTSIPVSRSVAFVYNPPLQHSFLSLPGTYRFVMVQTQTFGTSTCLMASDTVVYDVRLGLSITLGEVKPSFPEPKRTGSIEIADIDGGTRFVSGTNELYYEVALYDADDDIVIEDYTQLKLDPQNKFRKIYEYLPPGVYRIKVRDASGCEKTIDAEITLDPSVYVPNVFTPNDDNVNDTFEVLNLPLTGQHKLIVSNRWGSEVFKSNDYRDGNFWNANDAGDTYTGWVEIIRGSKP